MKKGFKEKLKEKLIPIRKKFLFYWTKIKEEKRLKFLQNLSFVLNYLFDSVLISIPLTILIFKSFPIKKYLIIVLCMWIVIPYLEHYYIWVREKWKDNLLK